MWVYEFHSNNGQIKQLLNRIRFALKIFACTRIRPFIQLYNLCTYHYIIDMLIRDLTDWLTGLYM